MPSPSRAASDLDPTPAGAAMRMNHALHTAGYRALHAPCSEVRLHLTISPRCGQAFRWREHTCAPLDPAPAGPAAPLGPARPATELAASPLARAWSLCLADRVVLVRQDPDAVLPPEVKVESNLRGDADAKADVKPSRGCLWHKTIFPSGRSVSAADEQATATWLHDYLNLSVPLAGLYDEWSSRDPVFAGLAAQFDGVRVLRQDPWECLCAFICSSNNNIARIGQMVQKLATHFSPPLLALAFDADPATEPTTFHPFPPPEALAQPGVEATLRALGFGYRAKYLAHTAQRLCQAHGPIRQQSPHTNTLPGLESSSISTPADSVGEAAPPPRTRRRKQLSSTASAPTSAETADRKAESELDAVDGLEERFPSVQAYLLSLRTRPYIEAREHLMRLPGIGPKVADCILLFSQDQPASIPVDRHVFAFAERKYHIRTKAYEVVADRLRALWGPYAGWAHGILFLDDLRAFRQAQFAAPPTSESPMVHKVEEAGLQAKLEHDDPVPQATCGLSELPTPKAATKPAASTATRLHFQAAQRKKRPPPPRISESTRKRAAPAATPTDRRINQDAT